jgi:hypothetical protein
MDKFESMEEALADICQHIYVMDKEEEFNQSAKPVYDPTQHVILNRMWVQKLFSLRYTAIASFPALKL